MTRNVVEENSSKAFGHGKKFHYYFSLFNSAKVGTTTKNGSSRFNFCITKLTETLATQASFRGPYPHISDILDCNQSFVSQES